MSHEPQSSGEISDHHSSSSAIDDECSIAESCIPPDKISELDYIGRFDTLIRAASDEGTRAGAHGQVNALVVQHNFLDQAPLDLYLRRGQILQSLEETTDKLEGTSFLDTECIEFEPLSISDGRQLLGCRLDTAPYPVDALTFRTIPSKAVWTPEATVQHALYVMPAIDLMPSEAGAPSVIRHLGQTNQPEEGAAFVRLQQGNAIRTLVEWANRWRMQKTEDDDNDDDEEGEANEGGTIKDDEADDIRDDNLDTYHMLLENSSGGYRRVLDIESLQQTSDTGKITTPFPLWFAKTREQARHKAENGSPPDYHVGFTARLLTLYRPSAGSFEDGSLRASEVDHELPQRPFPARPDRLGVLSPSRDTEDLLFDLGAVDPGPGDNRTD